MSAPRIKLSKEVEAALAALTVPWRVETGKKHYIIWVNGRIAAVTSRGKLRHGGCATQNVVSSIRRAAR